MSRNTARRWKRVLIIGIGVLVALGAAGAGAAAWVYARADRSNVGDLTFANPLAIPPLLQPTVDDDGGKVFDVRLQAGESHFVDHGPTPTWGLNGDYLGPTLRAARGDRVRVNVTNGVDETTTVHWHGMHLPAEMDGGPHQMIEPGETWSPEWTIDQPAATLWYHPHLHGKTADHVYRGAAGMFIVDDPAADVELPDTYGVDDIPLIIQDKNFDGDGSLDDSTPFMGTIGVLGDTILVNGTYDPHIEVTTTLVRFRVLNASNARVYNLGLTDDRQFWQIASDAGLLERPHQTRRVQLAPGERAEIVVPVNPGDDAILRSFGADLGMGFNERFNGGDDTFDIVQLRGVDHLEESPGLPSQLATIDRPDPTDAAPTRPFSLQGHEINGQKMDMSRIDAVVTEDTTEIWEVTNDHGNAHSLHPHLIHFTVLGIDGAPPPPELAGWKDTIYVPPHTTIRIIARFEGHADPDTPYMFHCHMLAHEDDGMMGQYLVVEPGDQPATSIDHEHEH